MKISKWHIDFDGEQYWVYDKKSLDKKTNKESPTGTSYFNTLAGALRHVRHDMIGSKIGQAKDDDLEKVIEYITSIDKYFTKQLVKLTNSQEELVDKIVKEQTVEHVEQSNKQTDTKL